MRSKPVVNLEKFLKLICKHPRGIRNNFQPVSDASHIYLTNCIIAPSTKLEKPRVLIACLYYDKAKSMTKDMGEIRQTTKHEHLTLELTEIPNL